MTQSLWTTLHDGKLLAARWDWRERTVVLEIDVAHLRKFHGLDNDSLFHITLREATSVLVKTFVSWNEEADSFAEQPAKGHVESFGWSDFIAAFTNNSLDIFSAEICLTEVGTDIRIEGSMDGETFDDQYFYLTVKAKTHAFALGRNPLPPSQFVELGDAYWNAWKAR